MFALQSFCIGHGLTIHPLAGGCPYAKGATGNVATEDVLYLLHGMGLKTGVDLSEAVKVGNWISGELGRKNASRVANALTAKL